MDIIEFPKWVHTDPADPTITELAADADAEKAVLKAHKLKADPWIPWPTAAAVEPDAA